jgi:hypothetical protein
MVSNVGIREGRGVKREIEIRNGDLKLRTKQYTD